jgi:predicted ester cyclase
MTRLKEIEMTIEQNKTVARRLIAAINTQDFAEMASVAETGLAEHFKERIMPWLYETFPGHHMNITDMIAEGDQVVVRLESSGGHGAEWQGIPAAGKQFTNTGAYFLRIENGKVVDMSAQFDDLNLVRQLDGVVGPAAE